MLSLKLSQQCGLCGRPSRDGGFCAPCRAGLARVINPCPVCGAGGHAAAAHGGGWRLTGVVAPFKLGFPLRELVHRLKYRGHRYLGRSLGELLVSEISDPPSSDWLLLPMPLHRSRLIERGYNQSFELAGPLAAAWQLPLRPAAVVRTRATLPQAALNTAERYRNLRGAFRVIQPLAGARVVVVDDVITTGASANALAAALLAAGAAQVRVITVARG